jgi:hypothetical protein
VENPVKLVVAAALLLATNGTFDAAKKGAMEVERPARAIAAISGACDVVDGAVSGECLENSKAVKDEFVGKRVVLNLGAGYETLLSFGGRNGDKTRFVWAPLYDVGNGLALTVGKPQKVSATGNVVVGKRPIDGVSPEDYSDLDLGRFASTGVLGIELVGRFGKPWSMSGGGKTVKGVSFEVEAMRLYNARNGKTVFESTQKLN